MCGIAGFIKISKDVPNINWADVFRSMLLQISNRGPDDQGFLIYDNYSRINVFGDKNFSGTKINYLPTRILPDKINNDLKLGFIHTRLSILDLSYLGHQPMSDFTGKYWIIYNGEIYNFSELRNTLLSLGYKFRSNTDTEVILYSYIEWGEGLFERLQGMFAFAILDLVNKRVVLGRDRIGIKPLFYFLNKDFFLFASNVRSIFFSGLYSKEINWEGLWYNFAFGFSIKPLTVFKDIYLLEPGHYLIYDLAKDNIIKKQYWEVPVNQPERLNFSQALEKFDFLLSEAVKDRLIADVEIASFLSGGIDSGLISSLANNFHSGIKCFTLTFPSDQLINDELVRAQITAKANNLNQIVKEVSVESAFDFVNDIIRGYEEPFPQYAPTYFLTKTVKQAGIKVILSGLGADELFGGYGYYKSIFKWRFLRHIQQILKIALPEKDKKNIKILYSRKIKNWEELYPLMFMNYPDGLIEKLFLIDEKYDSLSAMSKYLNPMNLKFHSAIETFNFYDVKFYLASHNLYHTDQFAMDNSVEIRVPFLDHRLVEFAFRLPDNFKVRIFPKIMQKYIVRVFAQKYLPPEIINSKKTGFNMPVNTWIRFHLKDYVKNIIWEIKRLQIFDNETIDKIYDLQVDSYIWHLIMFYHWYNNFFRN